MPTSRVLFITSNGAGRGHLTRCMAIARRLPRTLAPVLFTLSEAYPVAVEQGFFAEYFPSRRTSARFGETPKAWDRRFAIRLTEILDRYDPAAVVFDGTLPYPGLVQSVWRSPERTFVWCRRPLWKAGKPEAGLVYSGAFQLVVEPGDFAAAADAGPTKAREDGVFMVDPVLICDRDELLDRHAAARVLGLSPRRLNVLVSLGAGVVDDTEEVERAVTELLQRDPRVSVAVTRAPGRDGERFLPGATVIDRTPLCAYLRAFDFAVVASGYNSFHEVLLAGLPSLQLPNLKTAVDDQLTRARAAEKRGLALVSTGEAGSLKDSLQALLDDRFREEMAYKLRRVTLANGARLAARRIAQLAEASA
jgi:UDP-N-acetylglucosamine--N-acetylmuramyl-(pentapeptide) pyrophosphoryl-undecaprenol N-acetylglucosamine transferase